MLYSLCAVGKYTTRVVRTDWLLNPVTMRGQPGLFEVEVPIDSIPEEWRHAEKDANAEEEDVAYSETDIIFDFEV